MNKKLLVSIILPTYNETENIVPLIKAIHDKLKNYEHEIIVVDDNSPDGTADAVNRAKFGYVRLFTRTKNPSLGLSIKEGILRSKGDWIVIMDSDFNHSPSYLPILVSNLSFYDAVYGSRFVYGGGMRTRFRHYGSWMFNIIIRILSWKYITDSLYGFIAIRRSTLNKLDFEKIFWGYGDYCIRLTYFLQESRANILQIPTLNGIRPSGQSKTRIARTLLKYVYETLHLVVFAIRRKSS